MLGETGHSDESGRLEVPPQANQVFVKSVPPTISRKELEAVSRRISIMDVRLTRCGRDGRKVAGK